MHVVVLGNGIAGITAARHLRKRDAEVRITVVSGESDHHLSRPALMYVYLGHMRYRDIVPYSASFFAKNRIDLHRGWVTRIDTDRKLLRFDDGSTLSWDRLLIATGSVPNRWGWPGQDLERVQGFYSVQDLLALERATPRVRSAVIVGGGLIGIELAEMLHSRGRHATLLVREDGYWRNVLTREESALVGRVIQAAGIELRLGTELVRVLDDGSGGAGGVETSRGDTIPCELVGLTAGVRPNLSALADSGIETARGVVVDASLRTSHPDVFAAGDCAHIHPAEGDPFLEQVWYTGRAQGEVAAINLLGGERTYTRGIWFNSAKFLDLEYQVYGEIPNRQVDGVAHLYWEHPDGTKSLRICSRDGAFIGLQTLGMRYRHRVCERWIAEQAPVETVLTELERADFDPELYRRHGDAIRRGIQEVSA